MARVQQLRRQRLRPGHRAALALGERLARGELEGHRLGGDHVLERPALLAGEHRRVDLLGQLRLAQDRPAARAVERLVGRGRDHVRAVRARVRMQPRRHQAGEVRHVDHQQRAHLVGDLAKAREVELARVRRPARQQQLGPVLAREAGHLVHVDDRVGLAHVVGDRLIQPSRHVRLAAVREVAAVIQRQAEEAVPRLKQRVIHRRVGLRPGVRLHVGVLRAEQRLGAVDRQLLGHVHPLAAAVVAAPRIPLGVLVREHRALAFEHRSRREVLGGDQAQRALLALQLALQHFGDLGVDLRQWAVQMIGALLGHDASLGGR